MRTRSHLAQAIVAICVLILLSVGSLSAQSTDQPDTTPTTRHLVSRYALILFNFDSPELNPFNRRILNEFVYEDITPGSTIDVAGFTDIIGMEDRNQKLTDDRANAVVAVIRKDVPSNNYASLTGRGVGEEAPIYDNNLPEGRFYNRTVLVTIDSPDSSK